MTKNTSGWPRYHAYCMREAYDIAFMNLVVAVAVMIAATALAFSHGGTFDKVVTVAMWWVIFVRATHTNRIRPKQPQEESQ